MERKQALYFYRPRVKNILLLIMCSVYMAFGVVVGGFAFNEQNYLMSGVGALLAICFGFLIFISLKRIFGSKPYLILTEETLTISAPSKNAVPLRWEDIEGYDIRSVNFSKVIEIKLRDEEKYRDQMSKSAAWFNKMNDVMNYRPFGISWGQVKRKERSRLARELDRRAFETDEHLNELYDSVNEADKTEKVLNRQSGIQGQMKLDKKRRKARSQVNGKYLLQSYGISFLLTSAAFLLFYWSDKDENHSLLVGSFILYPFAKVIWDVLLGFRLRYKMDKDESSLSIFFYRLLFFIHLFLYFFSLVIAPFGIIYYIFIAVRHQARIKRNRLDTEISSKRSFSMRFVIFPLNVIVMYVLAVILLALKIENFLGLAALILYGVTFSVYVALYPDKRSYFLSLVAYLWRIGICFLLQSLLFSWNVRDEYTGTVVLFLLSLPLFLVPSYLFYLWGKGSLRRLVYHLDEMRRAS
ncbi:STM3941 family protein [Gracilibacillus sp. S3-1-1]|uniref:STM3941 family protein n=1 Tax=Gracilibacillus pellucidus TaxID=3095368 RepID=A0ACC6M356_9BACI|nr:STM3941 family protein [Gracilibacillus sp. S3-1-1]MDX8045386.1 STM3941 family protein [Gracilibacillus sp. S3-1-1]